MKPGRPHSDDPRKKSVTGHFNQREFMLVMSRLERTGLKRSEAVRLLLLNSELPQKIYGGVDVSASQAYARLQPLQSNLNQIAAWLNKTRPEGGLTKEQVLYAYKHTKAVEVFLKQMRHYILTTKAQS